MKDTGIAEILAPEKSVVTVKREERVRRDFWKTFRKAARYIPFSEDVVAGFYLLLEK